MFGSWGFGDSQSLKPIPDEHPIQPIEASNLATVTSPAWAVPVAIGTAVVAAGAAVYMALPSEAAPAPAPTPSTPSLQRDIEFGANYAEYKRCEADISKFKLSIPLEDSFRGWEKFDQCFHATRLRDHLKRCKDLRKANTDKWHGGVDNRHNPQLHSDIERALEHAEKLVKRYCQEACLK